MTRGAIALLAMVALCCADSWGGEDVSIDGYYKNFGVAYNLPGVEKDVLGLDGPLGSVSGRLRLNGTWWLSGRAHLRVSYDFAPRVQDRLLFVQSAVSNAIDPLRYRVTDFDALMYPSDDGDVESFGIFHNLDRAMLTFTADRFDVFVGRQPIAFGSARIVNPTDVIAPFSYEALDTEDRIGVDAVRARIPIGFMGEIDAGLVFGEDFEYDRSALFLRGKYYLLKTDISVLALNFRENLLLGVDIARSIGGAGFWLEAAHVFAEGDDATGRDYFRSSIGFDYSFENNTYVFIEYHFNQAGADDPDEYLPSTSERAYTDGSVYLLGRHYLTPGLTWEFTPLIFGSMQVLTNLSDQSIYITPNVEYNIAENIYLSGGAFIGVGGTADTIFDTASEFGSYPDIYFTSFRFYF